MPIASITRGLSSPSLANSPSVSSACSYCSMPRHQDGRVIPGDAAEVRHVADAEDARLQQVLQRAVVVLERELAQAEERLRRAVLRREARDGPELVAALGELLERVVGRALVPVALDVGGLQLHGLRVERDRLVPLLRRCAPRWPAPPGDRRRRGDAGGAAFAAGCRRPRRLPPRRVAARQRSAAQQQQRTARRARRSALHDPVTCPSVSPAASAFSRSTIARSRCASSLRPSRL